MPHNFVPIVCESCGKKFTAPNGTGVTTCGPCNAIFVNALREFLGFDRLDRRIMPSKSNEELA